MIKKLLSAVICVTLLVSVFPAGFALGAYDTQQDAELVDFLTSLGIYGTNDNMIYVNELITREDLASILSVFYGLTEESYPQETGIPDVVEDWSAGHIMTMVDMGILTKYSDGLFRPKDYVTKAALCKVFVTMTGYGFIAESKGGYPDGYVKQARELDILDGVDIGDPNEFVEKHEFTLMLCNTLTVPLLEMTAIGEDYEYEKDEDVTLLTKNLSIYKAEGFVTALPYVSLDFGSGAGEGKVIVGNTIYKTNIDLYNSLGSECEIYFRQTEDETYGTILHASGLDNGKSVIEVLAEDAISLDGKTFRYYDGNKTKDITLSTDFMLIFNGKRLTNYKKEHLLPPQGKVRFCDTNGDKRYDKVITDYQVNYHVANVRTDDEAMYIIDSGYKDSLVIGYGEGYWCEVFKQGKKCGLSDINVGDVLSIVADDIDINTGEVKKTSRVYRINISDLHISGTVTGMDNDGIFVDNVHYEFTSQIEKSKENIVLGNNYTFYLNELGKIVSYDGGASTFRYGLLLDYAEDANGFSDESKVRIFASSGQISNYDCTDKLTLDGRTKKSIDDFGKALQKSATQCQTLINADLETDLEFSNPDLAYTSYWQVIKYKVAEDGRLISIDTVAENSVITDSDLRYYASIDSNFTWVSPVMAVNGSSKSSADKPQKRFTLKDDTVLIAMEKAPANEKHFMSHTASAMHTNESGSASNMACIMFDADDMDLCQFMLVAEPGIATTVSSYVGGNDLMIYEGIRQKIHTDGEVYPCLYGTNVVNGSSVQVPLEDISLLGAAEPGDWLRWSVNADGVAVAVKIWICRKDSAHGDGTTASYLWRGRWGGSTRIAYARVEAQTDTHIKLRYDDEAGAFDLSNNFVGTDAEVNTFTETLKFPTSAKYFIYDSETSKTTPATMEDIRDLRNFGEDADMVAIKASNSTIQSLVIYR